MEFLYILVSLSVVKFAKFSGVVVISFSRGCGLKFRPFGIPKAIFRTEPYRPDSGVGVFCHITFDNFNMHVYMDHYIWVFKMYCWRCLLRVTKVLYKDCLYMFCSCEVTRSFVLNTKNKRVKIGCRLKKRLRLWMKQKYIQPSPSFIEKNIHVMYFSDVLLRGSVSSTTWCITWGV